MLVLYFKIIFSWLFSRLYCHAHQVLHKEIETDVFSEVASISNTLIVLIQGAWVHLYLDFSLVGIVWLGDKESWHWESFLHDIFCIFNWSFQKSSKVFISLIVVVAGLFPFIDSVTFPNTNIKESIQKKNNIIFHRINI